MQENSTSKHCLSLDMVRDLQFEKEISRHYDEMLPYHNFNHVLDTFYAAANILQRCNEEGIRVDTKVVYYALLFHDAGYRVDHLAKGYDSKERYAVAIADSYTTQIGLTRKERDKVNAAIMATHREGKFLTAEQKAVRAADLSGLGAPYPEFLKHTTNLWLEHNFLYDKLDWDTWVQQAHETITFYLMQEIRLTSYFSAKDGASAFHLAAERNLEKLALENEPALNHGEANK